MGPSGFQAIPELVFIINQKCPECNGLWATLGRRIRELAAMNVHAAPGHGNLPAQPAAFIGRSRIRPNRLDRYTLFTNPEQLEAEALKLDPQLRAQLADRLYLNLDPLSEDEWARLWAAEAERRNAQMTADPALGIPADEVFRKAYSKLK